MAASEEKFHLFGKLLVHVLLEEPLRILDMNRAGTKNMFMKSHMRQKLTQLTDEQFVLLRDVFIHLVSDGMMDLLRSLVHAKDGDAEIDRLFDDSAEPDTHYAEVIMDGEKVDFPANNAFCDIWVDKWQKESGVRPTRRMVTIKYAEHDPEYRIEGASYGDDTSNAPRLAMEKFGKMLIENCKDNTVKSFERYLKDMDASDLGRALSAQLADIPEQTKDALRDCVIDSAMTGIHDFLFALQESQDFGENIEVTVDGIDIVQASDGIHGEIFGEDGFDAKFSKYPNSDEIEEKYENEMKAVKKKKKK